jgi:hypothetical protein
LKGGNIHVWNLRIQPVDPSRRALPIRASDFRTSSAAAALQHQMR